MNPSSGGTIPPSRSTRSLLLGLASVALVFVFATPSLAATACTLTYSLKGWSAIYKTARGTGTITCEDGQSTSVRIVTHGAGFTGGTHGVVDGKGRFSQTEKVADLFLTYIELTGHAGVDADKNVEARAMFAGSKRLSLAGNGAGIGLGMAVGGFTIRGQ